MLDRIRSDEAKRLDETVTYSKQPLYDQLIDVLLECSKPDWEGEGSQTIDQHRFHGRLLIISPFFFRQQQTRGVVR